MMPLSSAVSVHLYSTGIVTKNLNLDTNKIWNNPFSGMIRLQGGTFSSQGRVEIYCNGQWGTMCNAGFDSNDATTLCRQLGYDTYSRYNHLNL